MVCMQFVSVKKQIFKNLNPKDVPVTLKKLIKQNFIKFLPKLIIIKLLQQNIYELKEVNENLLITTCFDLFSIVFTLGSVFLGVYANQKSDWTKLDAKQISDKITEFDIISNLLEHQNFFDHIKNKMK